MRELRRPDFEEKPGLTAGRALPAALLTQDTSRQATGRPCLSPTTVLGKERSAMQALPSKCPWVSPRVVPSSSGGRLSGAPVHTGLS